MRRKDREVTDEAAIRAILDRARVVHLAMIDGDRPYVVPLHYGYTLENGRLTLYLHSAQAGRKLDILRRNDKVAFVMETDVAPVSGGDLPCKYGASYASLMGEGRSTILTDPAEKAVGLAVLMKTQTDRDFTITEAMTQSVAVIRVDVETYSAKSRPMAH